MSLLDDRICRFCRKSSDRLHHYSVRSYAHTKCFLDRYGFEALMRLPTQEIAKARAIDLTTEQRNRCLDVIGAAMRP